MKIWIVILCLFLHESKAAPVFVKFEVWGRTDQPDVKGALYVGWINGFTLAGTAAFGTPKMMALSNCLEDLSWEQIIAVIDKYYKENPEKWHEPLSIQLLQALTTKGAPCAGKSPYGIK